MSATHGKITLSLLFVSLACFLVMDFAEARGRGGGGRGGGRSMSRGGPASSGSYQRSRARPQSNPSRGSMDRANNQSQRADRSSQRQDNYQDRGDQRQDNYQDRQDQRQDNYDKRYDNRKEYRNDRNEWYEDRWRRGAYLSIASWNRMSCRYTTVIVNGITYYDCNNVRYERVYRGSEVTFIIVN